MALLTGCVQRLSFGEREPRHRARAGGRRLRRACARRARDAAARCRCTPGDIDQARALARHNIEVFEAAGVDRIVVNAAGCGSAMKEYGELFADDPAWAQRATAFSAKVRDVSEVLVELGEPRAHRAIRSRRAWSITTPATWPTGRACGRSRARCCRPFPASSW